AMTVDPADECTFWYTNEYYSTSGGNWQTRIGSFKFPACAPQPNVSIAKLALGSNLQAGSPITFVLSIANLGSGPAMNVMVTDVLPVEVVTPSVTSSIVITQVAGPPYVWNVAPLT